MVKAYHDSISVSCNGNVYSKRQKLSLVAVLTKSPRTLTVGLKLIRRLSTSMIPVGGDAAVLI